MIQVTRLSGPDVNQVAVQDSTRIRTADGNSATFTQIRTSDRIIATCHAVYEPGEQNPDGNPRAWISNLTVGPEYRQRGIARMMLAAGIAHLRARGATSITLGVDAHDPAPFQLYRSVGFDISSSQEAWDKQL